MDKKFFKCPQCGYSVQTSVSESDTPACPHCGNAMRKSSPVRSAAAVAKPVQAKPVQTKPVQAQPVQAKPVQAKPAQVKRVTENHSVSPSEGMAPPKTDTNNLFLKILLGVVIVAVGLLGAIWCGGKYYYNVYLPNQYKSQLEAAVSQVMNLASPEEKIAGLQKVLAKYPKATKESVQKVQNLITEIKEQIKQEELRKKQEALLRKQAEEAARLEREAAARLKQEAAEKQMRAEYRSAKENNREEHIFVQQEVQNMPKVCFVLFRYDTELESVLFQLQSLKRELVKKTNVINTDVQKIRVDANASGDIGYLIEAQASVNKSAKTLPVIAEQAADLGRKHIVAANSLFHHGACVFQNIISGQWLLVAIAESGEIFVQTVEKKSDLPLFIKLSQDGFSDISESYYTRTERDLLQQKKNAYLNAQGGVEKAETELAALVEPTPAKAETPSSPSGVPDVPAKTAAVKAQERFISGLVFFAPLRSNLAAFGGSCEGSPRPKFATVDNIPAIQFSGQPDQGISFKWKSIVKDQARTVSIWFYCAGYNRYDGGNAMLSYGRKIFGKYFTIETNRSHVINWPWDTANEPLAQNIKNDRWNHLAITYDGRIRYCYLNGTKVSTYQTKLDTDATSLMIGTRLNDSRHCFVGSIRNVAVYNRALSQYEVKNIYRSYMGEGKKSR